MSEKGKEKNMRVNWTVVTTTLCLVINAIHYLTIEGSGHPVPSTLYNMIMMIIIIIISIHQKEMFDIM